MPTVSAAGTVPVHRDRSYAIDDDGLPLQVTERYEALVEQRDAAFAAVRASFEKATDLRDARTVAERELAELERFAERRMLFTEDRRPVDPTTGSQLVVRQPDTARLDAALRRVEVATERHERALTAHDGLAETHRAYASLVNRIEKYLQANRGRLLVADDLPTPRLAKGETPAAAVERIRERIAALAIEAKATARARTTVAEAKAQMRRLVEELANSGRPDVAPLFGRGATIRWPMTIVPQHNVGGYTVRSIDGAALFVFAMRSALIERLDAEIEAHGEEIADAMPSADRERRLRDIETEALVLGCDEDALIRMAAEIGHTITPRGSADPRAVLGLSSAMPRPKE